MQRARKSTDGSRLRTTWVAAALCVGMTFGAGACFRGGELSDKEPPAGEIGGACLDGLCNVGQCVSNQICYDPQDPCKGVYCGGNGTCFQDLDNLNVPVCVCDPGFNNNSYAYFCTAGAG